MLRYASDLLFLNDLPRALAPSGPISFARE